MDQLSAAWLAGLLEGEGSFCVPKKHKDTSYIRVCLEMTDEDIVRRAAFLMEEAKVHGPRPRPTGLGSKPYFSTYVTGYKAVRIMKAVLPFMGKRRSQRIKELIFLWENKPHPILRREPNLPPVCHPDRKHYSRGLCRRCHYEKYKFRKMNPNDGYHKSLHGGVAGS